MHAPEVPRTCLITGATSGIGIETAVRLARLGRRVLGAGRSAERCAPVLHRLRSPVSQAAGAATSVFLATDDSLDGRGGSYWKECREIAPSRRSRDPGTAGRLWQLSEKPSGVRFLSSCSPVTA